MVVVVVSGYERPCAPSLHGAAGTQAHANTRHPEVLPGALCARPRPGGAADGSTELWVGSEGVTHRHDRLQHLKQARAPALAPTTAVSAQGGDFACDCERVPATTDGAGIEVYSGVRAHVRVTVRAEWPAVDDVPSEHHKVRPARAVRRV